MFRSIINFFMRIIYAIGYILGFGDTPKMGTRDYHQIYTNPPPTPPPVYYFPVQPQPEPTVAIQQPVPYNRQQTKSVDSELARVRNAQDAMRQEIETANATNLKTKYNSITEMLRDPVIINNPIPDGWFTPSLASRNVNANKIDNNFHINV